jgi:hypothetical protein
LIPKKISKWPTKIFNILSPLQQLLWFFT